MFVELRSNIKLSFSSLILREDFIVIYNFFNNNIFSVFNNSDSLLYFLKMLITVTVKEDYKDIEIKLDITTLY